MSKYNKYINNFANEAEYETYLNGSVAEVPNTALIDETGEIKMTKYLPNNYVMFGTTTGTQDFMIGHSTSEQSSADCIQIHVVVEDDSGINKMYVATEDVLKIPKHFYSYRSGFGSTEGKEILSIKKWKIDTSQVTSMNSMFYSCSSLTSLDLSSFNTSKVTDMHSMFYSCSSLTSLDLRNFDTSNVTSMNNMFYNCRNINKLYLSSSFFNSTSLTTYDFSKLYNWKDTESLAMFVDAIRAHDGTGKTVQLSSNTKNALTTEQKTAITNAGWTIA